MSQDRVVLHGSERPAPSGAERIGPPPASEPGELTVVVRRRAPIPENMAAHATSPGAQISRAEFEAEYGADPADLKKVEDYATSQGLTVSSVSAARRTVVLAGTLSELRDAFGAEINMFSKDGQTYRARTGLLTIPADLDGVIEGIFGFDQRPQARMRLRRRSEGQIRPRVSGSASYSPLQIAQAYQFPQNVNGAGQTIGIIELGGGYQDSDLATYFSSLNINPTPTVVAVAVDGGSNNPGDPSGADGEVQLDIEVAGAIANGAKLAVYFAPNTTQGFLDAITQAIHDTTNNPGVISISWGGPESTYTGQALTSYDQAFQDAKALGITVCVAAGDAGSADGETDGMQHADFPASSPNVLACGGTYLQLANGAIQSETVWNEGAQGGATGGGVSETFPVPSYQANANVPVSVNSSAFAGRGVPDVAGDADPNSGYNVSVDGSAEVVGGTSAVAPLWAALTALLNQSVGKNLGFLNAALYQIAGTSTFHDVTSGNNGSYTAGPGWDACTGWGSPIGSGILSALGALGTTPTPTPTPEPTPTPTPTPAPTPTPTPTPTPEPTPTPTPEPTPDPTPDPTPAPPHHHRHHHHHHEDDDAS